MCRRVSLSETSTFLSTTEVTRSGHNLDHLPVTVHMIFDFVQFLRKVLSLDRKGKARELQSYLIVQYRRSKKSNLKRKENIAKCCHKPCKVLFWRSFSQENTRELIRVRRGILSCVWEPIHWTTQGGREYCAHSFLCDVLRRAQLTVNMDPNSVTNVLIKLFPLICIYFGQVRSTLYPGTKGILTKVPNLMLITLYTFRCTVTFQWILRWKDNVSQ